jgi:sterol desaturase/sphingolipid hydroxylase (fatty acid hydroxylase superfamily)
MEMVIVNMGNFYLTHIIFRHSYFHNGMLAIIGLRNTILKAHEANNTSGYHQLHHIYRKCNYGLDLFMDRLMGTEKMPE